MAALLVAGVMLAAYRCRRLWGAHAAWWQHDPAERRYLPGSASTRNGRTEMPNATSLRPMWPKSVMMRKSQHSDRQQPPAGHAPRIAAT